MSAVPFSSLKEVEEYLNNKRLICLECDKDFINLALHIKRAHFDNLDEYREKYNIPYQTGLVGCELKKFRQEQGKLRLEQAGGLEKLQEQLKSARETKTGTKARRSKLHRCGFKKGHNAMAFSVRHKESKEKFRPLYKKALQTAIKEIRTLPKVCEELGFSHINISSYSRQSKHDKEICALFDEYKNMLMTKLQGRQGIKKKY